ncbi:hypothetical protein D3C86_2264110 [compost metagenome]
MAISLAPLRLASWARVQKCKLDAMGLPPQMMISLASWKCSRSVPVEAPTVYL